MRGLVPLLVVGACGDNLAAPDASVPDAQQFPPFASTMPKILNGFGPVMPSVSLVPVFFPNDPLHDDLIAALDRFAASPAWSTVGAEYHFGPLTIAAPIEIATLPAAITETDIQTFLTGEIGGADDLTTIYALFYPASTTITGDFGTSCVDYGAFHDATSTPSLVYAVIPRCAARSTLDLIFPVVSHEMFEAATDPLLNAWNGLRELDFAWALALGGSEVADMCSYLADDDAPFDIGTPITRVWSNANAVAFHDPCIPIPDGSVPFFAAVPDTPDIAILDLGGDTRSLAGTKIALGSQRTIAVHLASEAATSPWIVEAIDRDGGPSPLGFAFDRTSGQSGDTMALTITALRQPVGNVATYVLISTLGDRQTMWAGAVEVTP